MLNIQNLLPGYVVSVPDVDLVSTTTFIAQVAILEYKSIICETFTSIIHIHAASCESTIAKIFYLLDRKTKKKIKTNPRYLCKGDIGIIAIELPHLTCLSTYKQLPQLGRFTLRDEGMLVHVELALYCVVSGVSCVTDIDLHSRVLSIKELPSQQGKYWDFLSSLHDVAGY